MKKMATFSLIWLALTLLAWFVFLHRVPQSLWEWLFVIVVAPPAYLFLEAIGQGAGKLFHSLPGVRHVENYVERKTAGEKFSALRILCYLGTFLLFIALGFGIYRLVTAFAG